MRSNRRDVATNGQGWMEGLSRRKGLQAVAEGSQEGTHKATAESSGWRRAVNSLPLVCVMEVVVLGFRAGRHGRGSSGIGFWGI